MDQTMQHGSSQGDSHQLLVQFKAKTHLDLFNRQILKSMGNEKNHAEVLSQIRNWHHHQRCRILDQLDLGTPGLDYFQEVEKFEKKCLTWRGLSLGDLTAPSLMEDRVKLLESVSTITDEVLSCLRDVQKTGESVEALAVEVFHGKMGLEEESDLNKDFRRLCLEFVDDLVRSLDNLFTSTGAYEELDGVGFWAPWTESWFKSKDTILSVSNPFKRKITPMKPETTMPPTPPDSLSLGNVESWKADDIPNISSREHESHLSNQGDENRLLNKSIAVDHKRQEQHSGTQQHECPVCRERFEKLESHMQSKHLRIPVEYKCTLCDKVYNFKSSLNKHISNKHKETGLFQCNFPACARRFFHEGDLTSHIEITHSDAGGLSSGEVREYEVERILEKRGLDNLEYRVRWKGFGPEDDSWENASQLGNAVQAVNDFEVSESLNNTIRSKGHQRALGTDTIHNATVVVKYEDSVGKHNLVAFDKQKQTQAHMPEKVPLSTSTWIKVEAVHGNEDIYGVSPPPLSSEAAEGGLFLRKRKSGHFRNDSFEEDEGEGFNMGLRGRARPRKVRLEKPVEDT